MEHAHFISLQDFVPTRLIPWVPYRSQQQHVKDTSRVTPTRERKGRIEQGRIKNKMGAREKEHK